MHLTRTEIEQFKYSLSLDSEKTGMALAVLVIVAVIGVLQWLILHFINLNLAIVLSALAAFVFSWIYVGLRYATPNGGNYSLNPLEYLIPTLLLMGIFMLILWGVYLCEAYIQTGTYHKWFAYLWIGICIVLPMLLYAGKLIYNYICLLLYYHHYARCQITLQHYSMLPIEVYEFRFVNSKTGKEVCLYPGMSKSFLDPNHHSRERISQKHSNTIHDLYTSDIYQDIPRHTDQFYLSWFSPIEGTLYKEDYTFDYKQLKERISLSTDPILLPLRERRASSIKILILKDGKIDLYIGGILSFTYKTSQTVKLHNAEVLEKRMRFKHLFPKEYNLKALVKTMETTQALPLLGKLLTLQKLQLNWKITLTGIELEHKIGIIDCAHNQYHRSVGFFGEARRYFLPCSVELYAQDRMRIYMDPAELYDAAMFLVGPAMEMAIDILISVKNPEEKKLAILLRTEKEALEFKAFEVV